MALTGHVEVELAHVRFEERSGPGQMMQRPLMTDP